ncbi:MAG: cytochrome c3 family protein [bacterium]|nr:cytochrome c3 family protein [bacterium]
MKRHHGLYVITALALAALLAGCWGTDKSTSLSLTGGGVAATATPVGLDKCHNCHAQTAEDNVGIFDAWLASKHGNPAPASHASYANFAADPTCNGASCHDPQGDGYNLSKFTGSGFFPRPVVGCEACHGGGSEHFGVGPMAYPTPDALRCAQCHNATSPPEGHRAYHQNGWGGKGNPGIYMAWWGSKHANSVNSHVYDRTDTTKVRAKCAKCHTDEGGRRFASVDNLTLLDNATNYPPLAVYSGVQCRTCHKAHGVPGLLEDNTAGRSAQYNTCTNCHQDSNAYHDPATNPYGDLAEIITDTHFDNVSRAVGSDIQGYVIRKDMATACTDCHNPHSAELTENRQWKASGHGDFGSLAWKEDDWKTSTSSSYCKRCHTTTSFIIYTDNQDIAYNASVHTTTFAANSVTGNTSEMLYCRACHKVASTGFTVARRTPQNARIPGAWDNGQIAFLGSSGQNSSYTTISGKGDSELCMNCHSTRPGRNGFFLEQYLTSGGRNIDNVAMGNTPHYLTAVQTLFQDNTKGIGGYALPGKDYTNPSYFEHDKIGTVAGGAADNSTGPCVGRPMSSPTVAGNDNTGKHSFLPFIYDDHDARTAIVAISSTKCAECHNGAYAFTIAGINAVRDQHAARLVEFRAALVNVGIYPNDDGNRFYTSASAAALDNSSDTTVQVLNWQTRAGVIGGINGTDLFGIAWNFDLLNNGAAEPGAWAHNNKYAGRLIYDAIGALGGTPSTTNFPGGRP